MPVVVLVASVNLDHSVLKEGGKRPQKHICGTQSDKICIKISDLQSMPSSTCMGSLPIKNFVSCVLTYRFQANFNIFYDIFLLENWTDTLICIVHPFLITLSGCLKQLTGQRSDL